MHLMLFLPFSTLKTSTMIPWKKTTTWPQTRGSSPSCTPSLCPSLLLVGWSELCWWADWSPSTAGQSGRLFWQIKNRPERDSVCSGLCWQKWICVFKHRKGTLVRTTVLVFIGGCLMGFSRACRMPAMVIIGRFITGIHSGKPTVLIIHPDFYIFYMQNDLIVQYF